MNETTNSSFETSGKKLIIIRVFNAPRELLFKAFAEVERIRQWWVSWPDFYMRVKKMEFKPGGIFHYLVETQDEDKSWGKFVYQEIESPEKIVYISYASDESGNIVRGKFNELFPLEIMNTVILTEEDDNKTRLNLTLTPHNALAEEEKYFEEIQSSIQKGFKKTFDQLEEYLSKV